MTRTRLTLVIAVAVALALVVTPLTAGGQEGRPDGAVPGTPTPDPAPRSEPAPANGWDGDGPAPRTLVHSGDSTIQGGLCVGFDCASNEPMGFATIKIEENNLRIAAADSSTVSGFPTTDWQIEFNSSSSGGGNYFMVRDCGSGGAAGSVDSTCGGTPMLTIEGGADNESIHVDSSGNQGGNVGFGTATPVVDLHALSGNTPTLRLDQDNSSGFTPQSWDLAGNESNFFIRDVTNGSALPFRIEPGTASNTLYLDNQERIGILTTAPEGRLHIRETSTVVSGDAAFIVMDPAGDTNTGNGTELVGVGTDSPLVELHVASNHSPQVRFEDIDANRRWDVGQTGIGDFLINDAGDPGTEFLLQANGTLLLEGAMVMTSDRNAKRGFAAVDPIAVLNGVAGLDLTTWAYRNDPGVRHIGPTAQEFHAAFGVGMNDKTIASVDADGVALAAIQALYQQNQALAARVAELEAVLAGS